MEKEYHGMYRAIVVDNNDPERRGRIRVQCPFVLGDYLSAWCEPCIPYATDYAGDYYVPPVGEGIWVQFEEGNVDKPIWNGGWYKINSSPLVQGANPEDFRYIVFKNSVMRMGQNEFIFELREGEESHTVTISPETWIGLNYISHFSEDKIMDLETLVINKEWLLVTRPEEENKQFEELQKLIASLGEAYNNFTQNVFPETVDNIYEQIQQAYDASHSELESVVEQLGSESGRVDDLQGNITDLFMSIESIKEVMNANTEKINEVFNTISHLEINGERVFDDFPTLDLV